MKYAVIKSGGKQYRVSEGDIIEVEKLGLPLDKEVLFDKVLLYVSDNPFGAKIGKPFVSDVLVKASVLEQKKGGKIKVSKFKAKSKYRRTVGHRQLLTKVKINSISLLKEKTLKRKPQETKVEKSSKKED